MLVTLNQMLMHINDQWIFLGFHKNARYLIMANSNLTLPTSITPAMAVAVKTIRHSVTLVIR